ncbi:hypothetical protein FOA52_005247 [Chlamydomonas sp. UWO 241]|nr:hypothetical protein FOA52_005247 [Chlamydomonas sp. UWO 241]
MAPSEERTRRLMGILAQEHGKTSSFRRSPAKFREMSLDTHKCAPAENWGPSPDLLPPDFTPPPNYLDLLKTQRTQRKTKSMLPQLASNRGQEEITYASVFKPRPDQRHTATLSKHHREKMANSEWALLDTLEVELYNNEKAWREKMKHMTSAEQRAFLDAQIAERKGLEEEERLGRKRDADLIASQMVKDKAAKAVADAAKAKKDAQLRKDRIADMGAASTSRQAAVDTKRREEAQMLADIEARLALEKVLAAEKFEQVKENSRLSKLENERRIQTKKDAHCAMKKADDELIKEGIKLAEERDRKRIEEQEQFKKMVEARVKGAGQKALEDNRAMIEREERLMKERMEKMERDAEAKEAANLAKKEAHKAMLKQSRDLYVAEKERQAAESRAETLALKELIDNKTREEQEAADRKMAALRANQKENESFVRGQAAQVEVRNAEEFVGMSSAERQLNRRLLKQAQRMVGPVPRQLTAQF